ncbi:N-acetyltransferase [Rhodosalinus halophilus]|uniref:N-acetyltransferase n=1 Tax=Rhodosalinus halophilus TaxID=2259333 RepID=A0A365U538_9RHOB|nr:GNAT family N-acetyltransferase [Rhodosalinus halophilus]RBI83331.1 N-acetyltransferase [Rhodosalinus halophilus]
MIALQRSRLESVSLGLRLVTPDDAGYVLQLRQNPRYNAHLSPVTGTVADQRAWIDAYKQREAEGREAYYIIERRDGTPCGTVRLYDIEGDRFTWGSWILDANKPPKAALESAVLIYDIGFLKFGKARAVFDVRRDNARTLAFHRRFGATETGADDENVYFTYPRDRFLADRSKHLSVVQSAAETG